MAHQRNPRKGIPTLSANDGLSSDQEEQYQHVRSWLAERRSTLGPNKWIELDEPTPTIAGITCVLTGVVDCGDNIVRLFHSVGGSDVRSVKDDVTREHVYRVDFRMQSSRLAAGASASEGGSFLDEPRTLIIAIAITLMSATFTTPWAPWLSLARGLGGVLM